MARSSDLQQEIERVFGASARVIESDGKHATVAVDGWPDQAEYHIDSAVKVLRQYPNGWAAAGENDADLRSSVERVGARLK